MEWLGWHGADFAPPPGDNPPDEALSGHAPSDHDSGAAEPPERQDQAPNLSRERH